jgi:hypothetical protein
MHIKEAGITTTWETAEEAAILVEIPDIVIPINGYKNNHKTGITNIFRMILNKTIII